MIVNKVIYDNLQLLIGNDLTSDDFNIIVDKKQECVKFINEDKGSSITLFTKANTMRYITYSLDDLMSEIISKFGYKSNLHVFMDRVLIQFKLI